MKFMILTPQRISGDSSHYLCRKPATGLVEGDRADVGFSGRGGAAQRKPPFVNTASPLAQMSNGIVVAPRVLPSSHSRSEWRGGVGGGGMSVVPRQRQTNALPPAPHPSPPLASARRGEGKRRGRRACQIESNAAGGLRHLAGEQRVGVAGEAADRAQRDVADDARDAEPRVVDQAGGQRLIGGEIGADEAGQVVDGAADL